MATHASPAWAALATGQGRQQSGSLKSRDHALAKGGLMAAFARNAAAGAHFRTSGLRIGFRGPRIELGALPIEIEA